MYFDGILSAHISFQYNAVLRSTPLLTEDLKDQLVVMWRSGTWCKLTCNINDFGWFGGNCS